MNTYIDGDNEKGLLCPIIHFSLKISRDNAASKAYVLLAKSNSIILSFPFYNIYSTML